MISPDAPSHIEAKEAFIQRFFCFFSSQKKRRPRRAAGGKKDWDSRTARAFDWLCFGFLRCGAGFGALPQAPAGA